MIISVLTNNSCPNSRAFNCPLIAAKSLLSQKDISLRFHYRVTDKRMLNADALMINSNVFRSFWRTKPAEIFRFLDAAKTRKLKVLWFDTTDSTWVTQFPVLPFVDLFLKSQIHAEASTYLKTFRTGRVYTDYFDELYQTGEQTADFACPADNESELQKKLRISWNTCFENYTESRLGLSGRLSRKLRPYIGLPGGIHIQFTPPAAPRSVGVSCRIGTTYDRPSVTAHRKAVIGIMKNMGVSCGKIPLPNYFAEMRQAKIGIGPFGVGEITLRDYEIIICGCALVKPDMSHLATWPALFVPGATYVPCKWDLADLKESVEALLKDDDRRTAIATAAQERYRQAVSPAGIETFAERLTRHLADCQSPGGTTAISCPV